MPELTQFIYNGFATNNLDMVVHKFAWDLRWQNSYDSLSRNGLRQGYFVACVEPLPPLRKKRRRGDFFLRVGGWLYSIMTAQLKSPFGKSR